MTKVLLTGVLRAVAAQATTRVRLAGLFSLLLAAGAAGSQTSIPISRKDAFADLNYLVRTIEKVHPDPYAVRSRAEILADRDRIAASLPESMTQNEFWRRIVPLVASYGDGHTQIRLIDDVFFAEPAKGPLFRASLVSIDGQIFVDNAWDPALRRGDRILSLNGESAADLMRSWQSEVSGEREAHRTWFVGEYFAWMAARNDVRTPFTVRVEGAGGQEREVPLSAGPEPFIAILKAGAPQGFSERFNFRKLDAATGYMDWRDNFGDFGKFKKDIVRMIAQLNADHATALLIDIRKNPGGDPRWGVEMAQHFAKRPFVDGAWDVKFTREMIGSNVPRWVGWTQLPRLAAFPLQRFAGKGASTNYPARGRSPFFEGNVCILTGPGTFSAAVHFADLAKTSKLATIVGEETGGTANTHSIGFNATLPHSHLALDVSTGHYWRANGDRVDRNGVRPDIEVAPAVADLRAGRDAVLERAMSCPSVP